MLRVHSDKLLSLALAAASIGFRSSPVKRTGTILPFASPFGSFGLPTFLAFFGCISLPEFLHDGCSYRILR